MLLDVEQVMHCEFPLKAFFTMPTIEQMAIFLEDNQTEGDMAAFAAMKTEDELTLTQLEGLSDEDLDQMLSDLEGE